MLRNLLYLAAGVSVLALLAPRYVEQFLASRVSSREVSLQEPQTAAAPVAVSPGSRVVRLEMDRSGHFFSSFRLNGRPVLGLIDTGATTIAINEITARQIGLRLGREDFHHEVSTANGVASAARATIAEIGIGSINVRNVEAMVLADQALDGALIGMSFLKKLRRFEISGSTLTLQQ